MSAGTVETSTGTKVTILTLKKGQTIKGALEEANPGVYVTFACFGENGDEHYWIGNTNSPSSEDGAYFHVYPTNEKNVFTVEPRQMEEFS